MERIIEVGKIYRHFKGNIYIVTAIAYDSENYDENNPNRSRMVVYEDVNKKISWVRPYDMFNSLIDREKYPNIDGTYRFEEIETGKEEKVYERK